MNTHLFTLQAEFFWSHSVHCFSFFSANIEARIENKVIFKIYISGLLTNVLTFNPRWLKGLFLIFKNGHISASRAKIETLRALSFLQLLKFEKDKYLYFFDCRPVAWDMAVFWFKQVLYLNAANHSLTLSTPYKKNPHSPQKWLKCTWNLYKYWECVNMFYLEANVISRLAEGQS